MTQPPSPARYDLYYWAEIPGRGEVPRLVLEAAGVSYRDVARLPDDEGGGAKAMLAFMEGRGAGAQAGGRLPFAPPFLVERDTGLVVSQSAVIAFVLGERHALAPEDEAGRLFARSVAATTADLFAEAHDVHHPVGVGRSYEDQRAEAARRATEFRATRIPKFLGWYERLVAGNPAGSGTLVGSGVSHADLGLLAAWRGLRYAFPTRMRALAGAHPGVEALAARLEALPRIRAYHASGRAIPFDENGIFRHYPELDGPD